MSNTVPGSHSQTADVPLQGSLELFESSAGLEDEFFNHAGCSLAVRPEARRLCRNWLQVQSGHQVWDIGAGTGSVALVSALRNPRAHYFALEKSPAHYRTLCRNIRRLGLKNVQPWLGEAPRALQDLPSPDRVYLGGTGGRVNQITRTLVSLLNPTDRLVASFTIDRNYARCRNLLRDSGFRTTNLTIHFDPFDSHTVHFLMARPTEGQRF